MGIQNLDLHYYAIRHTTRFRYSAPITQSVMEVRMQPRTEGTQRALNFNIALTPNARLLNYRDYLGNTVHHFDIPGQHRQLLIAMEAMVEMRPQNTPPEALTPDAWAALDAAALTHYDMLQASHYTQPTPLLDDLAAELNAERRDDPLTVLREINSGIYHAFQYKPQTTDVNSPIDDALRVRQGVCQDFSHIMLALARKLGIPCRYVSGYLFHRKEGSADRSAQDATHAWVEAYLPDVGWQGFDPTNNLLCGERHIRVAIGRDYADVPPTRGVFKGEAESELSVGVSVNLADEPPAEEDLRTMSQWSVEAAAEAAAEQAQQMQQ